MRLNWKLAEAFLLLCAVAGAHLVSQERAPGHLVRLSHNDVSNATTYEYDDSAGRGITVYVLDGGIRLTHREFEGRATFGANFTEYTDFTANHQMISDREAHGTHVAGIIGGKTYGVAKKVNIVSVEIEAKESQIIKALDFVLEDVSRKRLQGKAVISMSMHVDDKGTSDVVDRKFKHVVDSGIVCVVSAGNSNEDAGNQSPAREPSVITVAAIDHRNDERWENSNYGSAVDIYAPGVGVQSAYYRSDDDTATRSGTSQGIVSLHSTVTNYSEVNLNAATPYVAGLAAYIMALEGISQPEKVISRLRELSTKSRVRVPHNAPNTTDLIASNALDTTPKPRRKLPWISDFRRSWQCNSIISDGNCGTRRFCAAFDLIVDPTKDLEPNERRLGFFKDAQECFDAHEPGPKLPWLPPPPVTKPRAAHCSKREVSRDCPESCGFDGWTYTEKACGTRAFCEAHNRPEFAQFSHRPDSLRSFANEKACLDVHEL